MSINTSFMVVSMRRTSITDRIPIVKYGFCEGGEMLYLKADATTLVNNTMSSSLSLFTRFHKK